MKKQLNLKNILKKIGKYFIIFMIWCTFIGFIAHISILIDRKYIRNRKFLNTSKKKENEVKKNEIL